MFWSQWYINQNPIRRLSYLGVGHVISCLVDWIDSSQNEVKVNYLINHAVCGILISEQKTGLKTIFIFVAGYFYVS